MRTQQSQPPRGLDQTFGRVLRDCRTERRITQEELGHASGFDRSFISALERGLQSPTLRTLKRIAATLNVSVSELIGRAEETMSTMRPGPRS